MGMRNRLLSSLPYQRSEHCYMCIIHDIVLVMVIGIYMHFPLTQDGGTPLFIASQNGHSDVVNTLIRNGADVNLSWKVCTIIIMYHNIVFAISTSHSLQGVKSIDIARTEGHTAIVQLLERRH